MGGGGCPNVGPAGGYTLGGGYSWYSKMFGPMADHIVEIEAVLADGTFVKVSKDTDAELFSALRGGGFGLGVVTAVTAKTVPDLERATDFTDGVWSCTSADSFSQLLKKYWDWWVALGDKQQNVGRSIEFAKTSNKGINNDGEYKLDYSMGILFNLPQAEIDTIAQQLMTLGDGIQGCTQDEKAKQRDGIDYIYLLYNLGKMKSLYKNAKMKKHGSYNYAQSSIYLKMEELKDTAAFTQKLMTVFKSLNADAGISAEFELNMGNLYGNPQSPKQVNPNMDHSMNSAHGEAFGLLHFLKEIALFYPDPDSVLLTPQLRQLQQELPNGVVKDECINASRAVREQCTKDIWASVKRFGQEFQNGARKVLHRQFPKTETYGSLADYDTDFLEEQGMNWQEFIWGTNYPKILAVKKRVDPFNTLTCHHCPGAEFPRNKCMPGAECGAKPSTLLI